MNDVLNISEIFFSIQGESTLAGLPSLFVRLSGCNLRCTYCDTAYAFVRGRQVDVNEILGMVPHNPHFHVTITGGEPLLQDAIHSLIHGLIKRNTRVVMFTNGTLPLAGLPKEVIKVVDIKTPWAETKPPKTYETFQITPYLHTENLAVLSRADQIKFVIRNRVEFLWALDFLDHNPLDLPRDNIIFSPEARTLSPNTLAGWILDAKRPVRLGLQLHKYINTDPEPPK